MKKQTKYLVNITLLILFTLLTLSSCTTIPNHSNLLSTYDDDNLLATIAVADEYINLNIKNKTNSVITLSVEGSTTTMKNGETSKLIPEGTIYLQANAVQSPLSITPNGVLKKAFIPASAIAWDNSNWKIQSWVDSTNFSLVFPYLIDGKQKFIIVQTSFSEKKDILGSVEASKTYWHLLFGGKDKYKDELYKIALEDAINQYGKDIILVNASYNGEWSPLSLVLYFDIFGYVDNITFKADVQKNNKE